MECKADIAGEAVEQKTRGTKLVLILTFVLALGWRELRTHPKIRLMLSSCHHDSHFLLIEALSLAHFIGISSLGCHLPVFPVC